MRIERPRLGVIAACLLLLGCPLLFGQVRIAAAEPARAAWYRLEAGAELQSLFHYRNDADFDRTRPFYDENGQSVGAFATVFRPHLLWRVTDRLRIYYELELGLNYWSKQNPDEQAAIAADVFVMKHREIYGEGELLDGHLGFKVGYSYFRDPTGLFLAHWIGNVQGFGTWSEHGRAGLFIGQIPDQTYEGINVLENNFKRDIFVFGAQTEVAPRPGVVLTAAISGLVDTHLVGQSRTLFCPSLHVAAERGRVSGFIDAALQAGVFENQALGGGDQTVVAWAVQGQAKLRLRRFELTWTLLLLSPDDGQEGNDRSLAFLYSGKSRSSTLMLTEDEVRDWYDNLDERMSAYRGGFFMNRAGLLVTDLKLTWDAHPLLQPSLIVGAGSVLRPGNALDETLVGVETDLLLEVPASEHLIGRLAVGALIPGGAGGALINRIDLKATDPIAMVEASLLTRY